MKAGIRFSRAAIALALVLGLAACAGSGSRTSRADAAQANLNLGVAYLRQGRPDLAIQNFEQALELDSRLAAAHSALALAHDQLGNLEAADEHYRRALRLEPSDPSIANGYAVFLCRQDRWTEAEPYFRRAASNPRYPTPAAALSNAGQCAREAGEPERAEEYFREALSRDPQFASALSGMLEIAYERQDYLPARAFLQRYMDARPAGPSVLLMCVRIERELGDEDAARRCAARLRREFPESDELDRLRRLERDAG